MFYKVYLYNFRNLANCTIDTNAKNIILLGENGQGKTNFLEAIYYFCSATSFREKKDRYLAKIGKNEFAVGGYYIDASLNDKVVVSYTENKKQVKVNNFLLTDRKELLERFPCLIYSYDDIRLAEKEQERRRRFFDQNMSFYDSTYIDYLRQNRRLIKEKNRALKERNRALISVYNQQLATNYYEMVTIKNAFLAQFTAFLETMMSAYHFPLITIELEYAIKNTTPETILQFLESKIESELRYGVSQYGAHRDSYHFLIEERDISSFLSTGQKRFFSILLKNSSTQIIMQHQALKPIILFDDIFVELDAVLKQLLITHLPSYEQAFFTFLPSEDYFNLEGSLKVFHMKHGELREDSA